MLLLLATGLRAYSQTTISGKVNDIYSSVVAVGTDNVTIAGPDGFVKGDTVLIIQMKGVIINAPNDGNFGILQNTVGSPGMYEFLIVDDVIAGTNIVFSSELLNSYDTDGVVQLIKVPYYESATVDGGVLTAKEWDSVEKTGGVVALIVGGTLELNDDIDVSGKGFTGGAVTEGDGVCVDVPPGHDERNKYFYPETSGYSGFKGESIAIREEGGQSVYPLYAKGKGSLYTGGGGGNGKFSGGGGGGNYGSGGIGEDAETGCPYASAVAGVGGKSILSSTLEDGLFMGSGGGSSIYAAGGIASSGGNGGGIVIIIADNIKGNGRNIKAAGSKPSPVVSGDAAAGGGGAGGAIAISVSSFDASQLELNVSGGHGGDTNNDYGSGGGGGGGRVWINIGLGGYGNVTVINSGGNAGLLNYSGTPYSVAAQPGDSGDARYDFNARLNGFLFNSVWSSITTSSIDSICYGDIPPSLTGTTPLGGVQPYNYKWQKSYDHEDDGSWIDISGGINLNPVAAETDTLWFRRVVTDDDTTPLVDESKPVMIIVQPLITDNIIGYNDTICYNQVPSLLQHFNTGPAGGNGNYEWLWMESTDGIIYDTTLVGFDNESYQPGSLTETTYYHRIVMSGRCRDTSNNVEVKVLPLVVNNTITADQTICEGSLFSDLSGTIPAGGDGSYLYQWESAATGGMVWSDATGISNTSGYDPDESLFPDSVFFRRIIYSGPGDVCSNISDTVLLIMHSAISGNTITATQTICSGSQPDTLRGGSTLSGGDGIYMYTWQDSSKHNTWTDIPGSADPYFVPAVLTDTTSYRRVVSSSDGRCIDISESVTVYVHRPLENYSIALLSGGYDTTLCQGAVPNILAGETTSGGTGVAGDYTYLWQYSSDNISFVPAPGVNDEVNYQPSILTDTTWFRRIVVSGECVEVSNTVAVNILELIDNNDIINSDTAVCYNTSPTILNGTDPEGGDGTYTYLWEESTDTGASWSAAPLVNSEKNYQPPALTSAIRYRRVVLSGPENCCRDTSAHISIGIHDLPSAVITSLADTICSSDLTADMDIVFTGASPWLLTYSDGTADYTTAAIASGSHVVTVEPHSVGTVEYQLTHLIDGNGCEAAPAMLTGQFNLRVYEDPDAKASASDADEVCGLGYSLMPTPSTGIGEWLFPAVPVTATDTVDASAGRIDISVGEYGEWTLWWKETNWRCVDSSKVDITFWEAPHTVDAGEDIITSVTFAQLDAVSPSLFTSATWSYPGDPSDIIIDSPSGPTTGITVSGYEKLTTYSLIWTVQNGACVDSDTVSVTYNPIPQGFSPDGNNINDTFEIPGLEGTDNELVIVNLSGSELARFRNYSSLTGYWDGKDRYGSDLPDGTYYYFLTITRPYEQRLSGYVIIKRLR